MSEPEKAVCYLTDYGDYDPDHLARLYGKDKKTPAMRLGLAKGKVVLEDVIYF